MGKKDFSLKTVKSGWMKTRKKGNLNKKRKKLKVICREVRTHDQTEK